MNPAINPAMKNFGSSLPVHSMKVCVVYSADSGKIHHQHSVLTLVGGREPTAEEMAKQALRSVSKRHAPPGGELHVLHVGHDALESGKRYRVDHAKQTLLPEAPRR